MSDMEDGSRGFVVDLDSLDRRGAPLVGIVNALPTEDELKIANCIVRIIMSRETRGLLIKRDNFSEPYAIYSSIKRVKFELMFPIVQGILKNVYGLQLVSVPEKVVKKSKKRAATDSQAQTQEQTQTLQQTNILGQGDVPAGKTFALISCLTANARTVLGEIWNNSSKRKIPNGRNEDDQMFLIPKYKKTHSPTSNIELIKSGVLVIIISLIILSEGRISETELLKKLQKFGLSESLNSRNSSINLSTMELIQDFIKREYFNKEGVTTTEGIVNGNLINYTLGRRLLIEFTAQSMYELVQNIYGSAFDLDLQAKTMNSIARAYGENLKIETGEEKEVEEKAEAVAVEVRE